MPAISPFFEVKPKGSVKAGESSLRPAVRAVHQTISKIDQILVQKKSRTVIYRHCSTSSCHVGDDGLQQWTARQHWAGRHGAVPVSREHSLRGTASPVNICAPPKRQLDFKLIPPFTHPCSLSMMRSRHSGPSSRRRRLFAGQTPVSVRPQ